jgi:hypothetical protein
MTTTKEFPATGLERHLQHPPGSELARAGRQGHKKGNSHPAARRMVAAIGTVLLLSACLNFNAVCAAATLSAPGHGLSVQVNETNGTYEVAMKSPAWTLRGSVAAPAGSVGVSRARDAVGAYQQVTLSWREGQTPVTGRIRLYDESAVVLFASEYGAAMEAPPAPFPCFTQLPADLHIFSHKLREFAPPQFAANEICTPWLLFDDRANALIVSPASHFMVASMLGDGRQKLASGFNPQLRNLPAGFSQQTVLAFAQGINRTWDLWGRSLLQLVGAKRPGQDADVVLKYLGYWTDNGAAYYYNYDAERGYAGTLQALVERYRAEQIPLRYLQLDSWWYCKSTTGADGKPGPARKVAKLPEGEWNRYGGTLQYRAHPFLFPDGLDKFQQAVGLPLVTHSRWIDPASPYHQHYVISGIAPVDPKWWDDTAAYLKASGIITYEQDWLDRIYTYSPAFSSDLTAGEAFLDNMARACAEKGVTLQYCMPYACYFLQGCRYPNLTTIRTCTDRFGPSRWNDFLYTSRLASALGLWPWSDVYSSSERNNVLLSTLSAGPVGVGDAIGTETKTNLVRAVRADGVIVKPDAPIVPTDSSYLADARDLKAPLLSSTFTDHGPLRTVYVFACVRPKMPGGEVRFAPSEFGLSGQVYVYDYFAGKGHRLDACTSFSAPLAAKGTAFYVLAPVGKSGIAFLGDSGKFVSNGRQRISTCQDQPGQLSLKVLFAEAETSVVLHGFAAAPPKVSAPAWKVGAVHYDPETQHFEVEVSPDPGAPLDRATGDPVRQTTVVLKCQSKLQARR